MRTLLLFAKYIALEESQKKIDLDHIAASFLCLKPFAKDHSELLIEKLQNRLMPVDLREEFMADRYKNDLSSVLLSYMAEKPVLPFSDQVSSFLQDLRPAASNDDWVSVTEIFVLPEMAVDYRESLKQLEQLKKALCEEVVGQEHAIEDLIDNMSKTVWQPQQNRPQGVFFFAGPPASGKTFLAERFAHHLKDEYQYRVFDMTQYTNANESFGLVGAKKTYDDSAPGELTTFVEKFPKSIIVFDEFEKAHTQVLLSLLRMLSAGFVTDEYTQKDIDFRNTIIVFTSNLGEAVYNKPDYLKTIVDQPVQARAAMISHLRNETKIERSHEVKAIPPELLSRLSQGSIILFRSLGIKELMLLSGKQLNRELSFFTQKSKIDFLPYENDLTRLLLSTFAPFFDVRDIKSNITAKVVDPVTDFIRAHPESDFNQVQIKLGADVKDMLANNEFSEHFNALKLRGEVLYMETSCRANGQVLILTYSNPKQELLLHVDDVEADGGIILDIPGVGFDDIAGHDVVKQRLLETVRILNHREQLEHAGVEPPKGMVLFGPPGTGKTMLARALASEAGLPIATCSGTDLLSDNFIKDLFNRVRKYAPCILFIDEIDALPKRGEAGPGADALMNRLLTEIDGFSKNKGAVFIVAATNRLDKLDEALLRSGRLDLHVHVPFLDKNARRWFIEKFLQYDVYEEAIDVDLIVSLTAGMSGADLEKVHRETVLQALSKNTGKICQSTIVEEINILKYGAKRTLDKCEKMLAETAFHEAGHAVISKVLMPERIIEQISIVPREQALGIVAYSREQDVDYTKAFWFSQTCVALAGRAAQVKQFGDEGLDTGAISDLKQAMWSAWNPIARYGMHPDSYNLDTTVLHEWSGEVYFKSQTEKLVKEWLDEATVKTDELVEQYWEQISKVAQALLEEEVLSQERFKSLIK